MYLGFASNKSVLNGNFSDIGLLDHFIAFDLSSTRYAAPDKYKHYGRRCDEEDTITMELNVRAGMIRFYCNNKDFGNIPEKIDRG